MTLYQAYINFCIAKKEIGDKYQNIASQSIRIHPELIDKVSAELQRDPRIVVFLHYTKTHPLTANAIISHLNKKLGGNWSVCAKLAKGAPEHIKHALIEATKDNDPTYANLAKDALSQIEEDVSLNLVFQTKMQDKNSGAEISYQIPYTLTTTHPFDEVKKDIFVLDSLNFYSAVTDGVFKSRGIWSVFPNDESSQFVQSVVIDYMKEIKINEKPDEIEREF